MMFSKIFRVRRAAAVAHDLYAAAMNQARQPGFYAAWSVPDTLDGRFDLLALHVWLVMRRLGSSGEDTDVVLSQHLVDLMFADIDMSLREGGVTDMSVGKRVKRLAEAFYGRVAAYDSGLKQGPAALAAAITRNLYDGAPGVDAASAAMATYVAREAAAVDALALDALQAGRISFGPVPEPQP